MKSLITYFYEKLKNSGIIDTKNIYVWAEDEKKRDSNILPEITIAKLSTSTSNNTVGIHNVFFQVSAWCTTILEAEELSQQVVELFNRDKSPLFHDIALIQTANIHDTASKCHGVIARFRIVVYNKNY